jgi:hypothetical protein
MGQVIAFPFQPVPYNNLTADLGSADRVLLAAIRTWVDASRDNVDPVPPLRQGLDAIGAHDAAFSIHAIMTAIARAVRRPVAIHHPRCPNLSGDEQRLLHAASLTQAGDRERAEKVLSATLLSTDSVAFVMGPLDGLGRLFAQARLFLSRRSPSNQDPMPDDDSLPWSPSPQAHDRTPPVGAPADDPGRFTFR